MCCSAAPSTSLLSRYCQLKPTYEHREGAAFTCRQGGKEGRSSVKPIVSGLLVGVKFRRLKFSWALQVWTDKLQAQALKTGWGRARRWATLEKHKVVAFQGGEVRTKIILPGYSLHFLDSLETGFSWFQRLVGRTEPLPESPPESHWGQI